VRSTTSLVNSSLLEDEDQVPSSTEDIPPHQPLVAPEVEVLVILVDLAPISQDPINQTLRLDFEHAALAFLKISRMGRISSKMELTS
jgi:hypothetical protein